MDQVDETGARPRFDRTWVRRVWDAQPGFKHGYYVDIALPFVMGLATLFGGWERVSGRAWVVMRMYGGPYLWGSVLMLMAVLLVLAPLRGYMAMVVVLRASAVVYGLAALWFLNAALADRTVSFWGVLFGLYVVLTHVSRVNAYRANKVPR